MIAKSALLATSCCLLFAISSTAVGQAEPEAFDVEEALARQRETLPQDAGYTIGDSRAYRLVMQARQTILDDQENAPQLALAPDVEERVFRQAVRSIAGTAIPENFLELDRSREQPPAAPPLSLPARPNPNAPSFDWRTKAKSTPVRDQRRCACCWCFAAMAAYECSHLILKGGVADALDASEQQILNCAATKGCEDDWYMTAWKHMQTDGTATEADVPYRAKVANCDAQVKSPYRVAAYRLVDQYQKIPDVEDIKQALCKYGPLAAALEVDRNFSAYKDGVFRSFKSDSKSINHAVIILGWDDEKSAWVIKNSWGSNWGETAGFGSERGYMYIDYETNNIGYAAAWVVAKD